MKKHQIAVAIMLAAFSLIGCGDIESSPVAAPVTTPVQSYSSVVQPVYSSSSATIMVVTPTLPSSSSIYVRQSSSSSVVTLADVCDAGALVILDGGYADLNTACAAYKSLLASSGLSTSEVSVCMSYEGCTTNQTVQQPVQQTTTIYVSSCNKSFECKSGDCLTCKNQIESKAASTGTYHSSGTCNSIKQQCFGIYY